RRWDRDRRRHEGADAEKRGAHDHVHVPTLAGVDDQRVEVVRPARLRQDEGYPRQHLVRAARRGVDRVTIEDRGGARRSGEDGAAESESDEAGHHHGSTKVRGFEITVSVPKTPNTTA